jgi:hypothetical protein
VVSTEEIISLDKEILCISLHISWREISSSVEKVLNSGGGEGDAPGPNEAPSVHMGRIN